MSKISDLGLDRAQKLKIKSSYLSLEEWELVLKKVLKKN